MSPEKGEPTTDQICVRRFEAGHFADGDEVTVRESRVTLFLNGRETVRLLCLPDLIEELVTGFLLSECLIHGLDDLLEMTFNPRGMVVEVRLAGGGEAVAVDPVRSITTGCGRGVTFVSPLNSPWFPPVADPTPIAAGQVIEVMRALQKRSSLFHETGGVHTAAAASGAGVAFAADDIGRHNAVDKVLGWKLRTGASAGPLPILAVTGRLSSEIVTKTVRGRFAVLISPSAPTSGAIQLGEALGVTIIGFARGQRFNVYTHSHRVVAA